MAVPSRCADALQATRTAAIKGSNNKSEFAPVALSGASSAQDAAMLAIHLHSRTPGLSRHD